MKKPLLTVALVALALLAVALPSFASDDFETLQQNQRIGDFLVASLYENENGEAIGAEFRHMPSNFVLDVLRIQSIPQGLIWVNTPPPTDMGEPHTMEHLVLGKGTKAQWVASFEDMSLSSSTAGTGQDITGYSFYTAGGTDVFYKLMEVKLDALIHANFSDEEIRRETCNIGYSINPADSSIQLEEKGSVYTEMVSGYESSWPGLWFKMGELLYGDDHPLSNESGGYPPAVREATAEALRKFHEDHYHLNNMGMIISIADDIPLDDFLSRTSEIFARLEPDAEAGQDPATAGQRFPEPQSAPYGTIAMAYFPNQNENEPGELVLSWPPVVAYDPYETILRSLLMNNLAEGEGSDLYKKFIDSETRLMDIGASNVWGGSNEDQGCPFYVEFGDVKQDFLNDAMVDSIRSLVIAAIENVANMADNSDELKEFNERATNRISQYRRELRKLLNSPPRFGFRGGSFWWMEYLHEQYRIPGFRKQLAANDRMAFAEELLSSGKNFWKDYIAKWQLLTNKPYAVGSKPDPRMIATAEAEREKRIEGYIEGFKKKYDVKDAKKALAKFVAEYDANTKIIDSVAATIETPRFVDNPPLVLDEHLDYRVDKLPGGGDNVVSTFDNITSGQVGMYLDMSVVPESLLIYVSAMPTLLSDVGVIKDGEPLAYDKTSELMRKEILNFSIRYNVNYRTDRVELGFTAGGSNLEEAIKGVDWLSTFLYDADWRTENLPRMRDALDATLTDARNGWKGWEEWWVRIPINTFWRQDNPLIIATMSFLTHQHSLMRVKWLLKESDTPETLDEFSEFIAGVSQLGAGSNRDQLAAVATYISTGDKPETELPSDIVSAYESLSEPALKLVKAAGDDLLQTLGGLPDGSLAADWAYLCSMMHDDLAVPPHKTLDKFLLVMELIRKQDNVRAYMVGSSATQQELLPHLNSLVEGFSGEISEKQTYSSDPIVHTRLRARTSNDVKPVYCGLVKESTRNGLVSNTVPTASFYDSDPNTLLDFLSARLYGGGGAHSMFMKTWAAGLAYSNGLRSDQYTGRLSYYAERCPSLVQTIQFVCNELKNADPDPSLTEYAISQAFDVQRAGATYEERGAGMAADLADGLTPEVVSQFRGGILKLRGQPDLFSELTKRMLPTYGRVLPGIDPAGSTVEGSSFLMIGPEMQFVSFEDYLKSVEGDDVTLYRIYPRDFWLTDLK